MRQRVVCAWATTGLLCQMEGEEDWNAWKGSLTRSVRLYLQFDMLVDVRRAVRMEDLRQLSGWANPLDLTG
jgi:hypothetical protein